MGQFGRFHGNLCEPAGIAFDSVGNWLVADSKNHRIQVCVVSFKCNPLISLTYLSFCRKAGHLTRNIKIKK